MDMKAVAIERFGGPRELQLRRLPVPEPAAGEIRIRVRHAGVNPVDWKIREGRLQSRLPHAFPLIPGWDASGEVDALGPGAAGFKKGDKVFAYCRKPTAQWGCYAEYVCVPASSAAAAPRALTSAAAGGVPLAALTAWQTLVERDWLRSGETALVLAAAGGVGGFVVQLAVRAGMRVLAVCSPTSADYVRGLGASETVNYRTGDFAAAVRRLAPSGVDLVFDGVGGDSLKRAIAVAHEGARVASIIEEPAGAVPKGRRLETGYTFVRPDGARLAEIAALIDSSRLKALPTEVLPLTDAAAAQERSQAGHVRGKLVLEL